MRHQSNCASSGALCRLLAHRSSIASCYGESVRVVNREMLQSILRLHLLGADQRPHAQIQSLSMHAAGLARHREVLCVLHKELLQSILAMEVVCWIRPFDCKNVWPLLLFAPKRTIAEHRM